jgi:hypothetical protein
MAEDARSKALRARLHRCPGTIYSREAAKGDGPAFEDRRVRCSGGDELHRRDIWRSSQSLTNRPSILPAGAPGWLFDETGHPGRSELIQ